MKKYRFVGRSGPFGLKLKIPYGEVVECVRWYARRKVLVKRPNGELVLTMGYYLRKIPDSAKGCGQDVREDAGEKQKHDPTRRNSRSTGTWTGLNSAAALKK